MERVLTLDFSDFGRELLEEQARRERLPVEAVVREAGIYYAAELRSGRTAAAVPPAGEGETRSPIEARADLDPPTWAALEQAAERQGITLERVLVHAVLLYVADVESGRLPRRLAEARPEDE